MVIGLVSEIYKLCGDRPPLNTLVTYYEGFGDDLPLLLASLRIDRECKRVIYNVFREFFNDLAGNLDTLFSSWIDNEVKRGFRVVGRAKKQFLLYPLGLHCFSSRLVKDVPKLFTSIHRDYGYIVFPNITFILNVLDLLGVGGDSFGDLAEGLLEEYLSDVNVLVLPDSYDLHLFQEFFGGYGLELIPIIECIYKLMEDEEVYLPDLHGIVVNLVSPADNILYNDLERYKELLSIFPGVEYIVSNTSFYSFYCYNNKIVKKYFSYMGVDAFIRCFNKIPHRIILTVDIYGVDFLYHVFRGEPYVIGCIPQLIYNSFMRGVEV